MLIGGSGTGKTTVANELERRGFHRLITTTTRSKREGEINHVHYHFVSEEEFWQIDRVEESKYAGNWYGLSKEEVNQKMTKYNNLVIVMDVNGAKAIKREYEDIVQVVFLTISSKEMEVRLRKRGGSKSSIQKRLKHAHDHKEFTKPEVADIQIENIDFGKTIETILSFTKNNTILN